MRAIDARASGSGAAGACRVAATARTTRSRTADVVVLFRQRGFDEKMIGPEEESAARRGARAFGFDARLTKKRDYRTRARVPAADRPDPRSRPGMSPLTPGTLDRELEPFVSRRAAVAALARKEDFFFSFQRDDALFCFRKKAPSRLSRPRGERRGRLAVGSSRSLGLSAPPDREVRRLPSLLRLSPRRSRGAGGPRRWGGGSLTRPCVRQT